MSVAIRDARGSRADQDWIARTYREYLDDLSAGNSGMFPALAETGHCEADLLLEWFRDDRSVPLVILSNGNPVGFARVVAQRARPVAEARKPLPDYQLVEFFVQGLHRRRGVGRLAAQLIFSRFAGRWLVTEESRNPAAVRFWRKVLADFTRGRYSERTAGAEVRHTFVSPAATGTVGR
jgi:predicted acetyltransferase